MSTGGMRGYGTGESAVSLEKRASLIHTLCKSALYLHIPGINDPRAQNFPSQHQKFIGKFRSTVPLSWSVGNLATDAYKHKAYPVSYAWTALTDCINAVTAFLQM